MWKWPYESACYQSNQKQPGLISQVCTGIRAGKQYSPLTQLDFIIA